MGTASVAQGLVTNQAVFEFVSISKQNVSQRDAFNPNLKYLELPKLVCLFAWCSYSLSITCGGSARIWPSLNFDRPRGTVGNVTGASSVERHHVPRLQWAESVQVPLHIPLGRLKV